jgi:O-antigen/teichoic acid export membrane protein
LGYPEFMQTVLALAGLYVIFMSLSQTAEAVYVAREKAHYLSFTQVAGALFWALAGLTALSLGKGLIWLYAALALSGGMLALLHGTLLWRCGEWPDLSWRPEVLRYCLRALGHRKMGTWTATICCVWSGTGTVP